MSLAIANAHGVYPAEGTLRLIAPLKSPEHAEILIFQVGSETWSFGYRWGCQLASAIATPHSTWIARSKDDAIREAAARLNWSIKTSCRLPDPAHKRTFAFVAAIERWLASGAIPADALDADRALGGLFEVAD